VTVSSQQSREAWDPPVISPELIEKVTVHGCRFTDHSFPNKLCRDWLCSSLQFFFLLSTLIVIRAELGLRENCLTGRNDERGPTILASWRLISILYFFNREPETGNRERLLEKFQVTRPKKYPTLKSKPSGPYSEHLKTYAKTRQ